MAKDIFIIFLLFRLGSVVLVQTWFVPDEYWQATEVAHQWVFGYGWLTWEWTKGVRSILYPGLWALLFRAMKFINFDYAFILIYAPRVVSAIFFSYGDYNIWILSQSLYGYEAGLWTGVLLCTSWFLSYCAPRTLTSCVEMVFASIALRYYPWGKEKESTSAFYLWFVGIGAVFRPTIVLFFISLWANHMKFCKNKVTLFFDSVVIGLIIFSLSVLLDSFYYGRLTLAPLNFIYYNAFFGLSSFYGMSSWHWYISQGIPSVMLTHLVPLLCAYIYNRTKYSKLLTATMVYIAVLRILLLLTFFIIPNLLVFVYFGLVHQKGPVDVIASLRTLSLNKKSDILFLMPCHSTPFYSHLHSNISMRFLTCEPNWSRSDNYVDEADEFYQNPLEWMQKEYNWEESLKKKIPTHIVLFSSVVYSLSSILKYYHLCDSVFNAHFAGDDRNGKYINIYCRT